MLIERLPNHPQSEWANSRIPDNDNQLNMGTREPEINAGTPSQGNAFNNNQIPASTAGPNILCLGRQKNFGSLNNRQPESTRLNLGKCLPPMKFDAPSSEGGAGDL